MPQDWNLTDYLTDLERLMPRLEGISVAIKPKWLGIRQAGVILQLQTIVAAEESLDNYHLVDVINSHIRTLETGGIRVDLVLEGGRLTTLCAPADQ